MNHQIPRRHRGLIRLSAGLAALGAGVGAASIVSAASDSGSGSDSSGDTTISVDAPTADQQTGQTPPDNSGTRPDPASLPNGPGETVLTGTEAAKVTAAAEAAEPGSTVIRVETDSSGHAYEAHVQLADGTVKTLYFDESFAEDGSEDGFGPAPANGQAPADAPTTTNG